jgi:outer membrane protein OmpA-like peptidoglycan-associated protein
MKPLLPFFLLLFTAAHSLCAQTILATSDYEKIGIAIVLHADEKQIIDTAKSNYIVCYNDNSISTSNTFTKANKQITVKKREGEDLNNISILVKDVREIAADTYNIDFFSRLAGTEYAGYFTVIRTKENDFEVTNLWHTRTIDCFGNWVNQIQVKPHYFKLTDTMFNVGGVYIIDKVYFDFDKWTIRDESILQMDSIVDFMKKNSKLVVEVGGHNDDRGSDEYSMLLTKKRAESVRDYLRDKGIKKKRLTAVGYEARNPIAPNQNPDGTDNPKGRQMNRRIELKILKTD